MSFNKGSTSKRNKTVVTDRRDYRFIYYFLTFKKNIKIMCFIVPLIINLLGMLYCVTNLKTKYNIIYILWFLLSFIPILSYFVFITAILLFYHLINECYTQKVDFKPTKLNKFLFGYEKRKN